MSGAAAPAHAAGSPTSRSGVPTRSSTSSTGRWSSRSYFKMPATQTSQENCVAHNGSIIPVPGRDIFVQAWYQGGLSVIDFTDTANPVEIAFFDRGPINIPNPAGLNLGGFWSTYWYNGLHLRHRDRPWLRHVRVDSEQPPLGERDRRGVRDHTRGVQLRSCSPSSSRPRASTSRGRTSTRRSVPERSRASRPRR